jgi:hypothetical protein
MNSVCKSLSSRKRYHKTGIAAEKGEKESIQVY